MRKQYHFRPSERGLQAWDIDRLIELSKGLPVRRVRLDSIAEVDTVYWFDGDRHVPTVRSVIEHARLIDECDLAYPIILSSTGCVMDGMHRIAKAIKLGLDEIQARRFHEDPPPDHVGISPRELPYD